MYMSAHRGEGVITDLLKFLGVVDKTKESMKNYNLIGIYYML